MITETSEASTAKPDLCRVYDLGLVEYTKAQQLQDKLVQERFLHNIPDVLLFLQHPPVLTIGASGGEQHITVSRDTLVKQGITVLPADRGGNITCHGPGQLVGYPIFNLSNKGRDLHQYMRNLEEIIITTLHDFSIPAHRVPGYTGVWVGEEKICAMGIKVTHWITKHGFAININNDLEHFSFIHPCGIADRGITSMSQLLGHQVMIEEVKARISHHFSVIFNLNVRQGSAEQLTYAY